MAAATFVGFFISWLFYITIAASFSIKYREVWRPPKVLDDGARFHYLFKFGAWRGIEVPQKSSGRVADHPSSWPTNRELDNPTSRAASKVATNAMEAPTDLVCLRSAMTGTLQHA